jgi:hypothetical protein
VKTPLRGSGPRGRHRRAAAFGMAEGVVFGQTNLVSRRSDDQSPQARGLSNLLGSSYEIAAVVSLLSWSYSRQRSGDHGREYLAADLVIHTRPPRAGRGQNEIKQPLISIPTLGEPPQASLDSLT